MKFDCHGLRPFDAQFQPFQLADLAQLADSNSHHASAISKDHFHLYYVSNNVFCLNYLYLASSLQTPLALFLVIVALPRSSCLWAATERILRRSTQCNVDPPPYVHYHECNIFSNGAHCIMISAIMFRASKFPPVALLQRLFYPFYRFFDRSIGVNYR